MNLMKLVNELEREYGSMSKVPPTDIRLAELHKLSGHPDPENKALNSKIGLLVAHDLTDMEIANVLNISVEVVRNRRYANSRW